MKTLQASIKNFNKRWKIQYDDSREFERFKRRVLVSFDEHLGNALSNTELGIDFIRLAGIPPAPPKERKSYRYNTKARKEGGLTPELFAQFAKQPLLFYDTEIWEYMNNIRDLPELIRCVRCVFWLEHKVDPEKEKDLKNLIEPFFKSICDAIEASLVPVNVNRSSDVLFYPKGAKLLDQKLVDDVLDWLPMYSPKARQCFESAMSEYETKHYRDSIDKMRVSLETFMRRLLHTQKSLENQKSLLGTYLENKNVPSDMRGAYSKILYQYTLYQNNVAKHPDDRNTPEPTEDEAEFIIYQTGVLMRFLIQLDSRQTTNA
jgi:uncharacterized protein (UPF0332 family)